ncbi:MAG: PilZ domain-containing protein [Lachnospiraceae bacterium]|nr:PilZ domain-containing protein [Lachnospiraceae bacterium]
MEEKRHAKRMDLECKLLLKRLDNVDGNAKEVNVDVKDVSKTGIGFACDEQLSMGSVYECLLRIWTGETLHTFVEIIRIVPKGGSNFYGGIFIGMPEMDQSRIQIYSEFYEANAGKSEGTQ